MKKFKDFLLKKLMNDIINDLKNEYNEELEYDKERYYSIIESITEDYFKNNEIMFIEKKKKKEKKENGILSENKCLARIWNNGYGNNQCTRSIYNCEHNLCKKHYDLFISDKLWLGSITEPRPNNPKRNGKVKKWND